MDLLQRIKINGYRSLRSVDLELRPLNVLIGANGAGKSNLISFFKLLNEMMGERLQAHIATSGRATSLLHLGPKISPQMDCRLEFRVANGIDSYAMRLFHAAGDILIFADEHLEFHQSGYGSPKQISLGAGHSETRIVDPQHASEATARVVRRLLNQCRVYHFHDTSPTARVRGYCYRDDHRFLMPDAGNLAAVLLHFRDEQPTIYRRIIGTIRLIAPFFQDFVLPEADSADRDVILNWRQQGSDLVFGPHQLSDGTLRAICLVSLLMQPDDALPNLIVVDEPELGLHPYALNVIASLFAAAATHTQVLVSTQSSAFLDSFEAEHVIIAERSPTETRFSRPDAEKLSTWLDEYSLGQVWEKNVIGGGPH